MKMAQIDFAVNEKRKMLHQERKKEKELEKRVSLVWCLKRNYLSEINIQYYKRSDSIQPIHLRIVRAVKALNIIQKSKLLKIIIIYY